MPKHGDIVTVDHGLAVYAGEAVFTDGDGNQHAGALVHELPPARVVPADSVNELGALAAPAPTLEAPTVVATTG